MKVHASTEPIDQVEADWLVLGVFEKQPVEDLQLPEALSAAIGPLIENADFESKTYQSSVLYDVSGVNARRVLLVGLGSPSDCTPTVLMRAASTALKAITKKQYRRVVFGPFGEGLDAPAGSRFANITCGALVGSSSCQLYRSEDSRFAVEQVDVHCASDELEEAGRWVERGRITGDAINLARELVNRSPLELYPESFCDRAERLAEECGLDVEVLGPDDLQAQGMGCLLGVGQASTRPPRLLILRHRGAAASNERKLFFVGKGVTFDSGGLSLKTAEGMKDMKCDMAGAATVLAATAAVAKLGVPVDLTCVIPLAENMPGGGAIRPGDVLTAKNGKTIEVLNTDAEGRLILADALSHAVDLGATHIVDLATLTGACMIALGMKVAGVMTNDEAWGDRILDASCETGELAWQLPMFGEFDELIRSNVADMKNTGGRWGGAITAAKLLERFVGNVPWTHVDIAGPSYADKESSYQDPGGTGYFVPTLIQLAANYDHA